MEERENGERELERRAEIMEEWGDLLTESFPS